MGEEVAAETPKRKRGRPPKPESEKVAAAKRKADTEEDPSAPKRGRGRPKGSKNKPAKKTITKGTSKRGRKSGAAKSDDDGGD